MPLIVYISIYMSLNKYNYFLYLSNFKIKLIYDQHSDDHVYLLSEFYYK